MFTGWFVTAVMVFMALSTMSSGPALASGGPALRSAPDAVAIDPSSGRIASWGDNIRGALGNNSTLTSGVPVAVDESGVLAGKTITQVAAGDDHTCALTSDKGIFCWGGNFYGQLGNGTSGFGSDSLVPVPVDTSGVLSGKTLTSVSAGRSHTCVVSADGAVFCWGYNFAGQLGNGASGGGANSAVPVAVDMSKALAGKTVVEVTVGSYYTCALASDGSAACWGYNNYGQLGNGTQIDSAVPVPVEAPVGLQGTTFAQISAGLAHTCAVTTIGSPFCWGYNDFGQLGNGSTRGSSVPIAVDTSGVLAGRAVTEVSAGLIHTCATVEGSVVCWGSNDSGQLGDGTFTSSNVPVRVDDSGVLKESKVSQIDVGYYYSCALTSRGSAACWGDGSIGQLGNGSKDPSPVPVAVDTGGVLAGTSVIELSAGSYHNSTVYQSAPAAPTALSAAPGYGQAMVSFTPGFDGGSPVTNYEYSLNPVDAEPTWIPFDPPVTDSPVMITGLTNGQTYSIALRAVNAVGAGAASARVTVTPLGAAFVPLDPYRAYDSRVDGGLLPGGSSRLVTTGVPAGAVAVAYNLTATGMLGSGLLTVTPGGVPSGGTSTLNFTATGQTVANAFGSGVDAQGRISVSATGAATHFVVDVVGYYMPQPMAVPIGMPVSPGAAELPGVGVDVASKGGAQNNVVAPSLLWPLSPTRTYDSRDVGAGGPLAGGQSRVVNVTAAGLVPPEATAVAYTLTQTGTVGRGWLAVGPAGAPQPTVSSINWFTANQTSANSSVVRIAGGQVQVWAGTSPGGSAQFVIDILGYLLPAETNRGGGGFTAIDPQRAYDSRVDDPAGPIAGGEAFTTSTAVSGVPAQAAAVAFNLTATGGSATGYLTVTPGGTEAPPVASTINWWRRNQTLANGSVVALPGGPSLPVTTFAGGGSTQYVIDVAGYYSGPAQSG